MSDLIVDLPVDNSAITYDEESRIRPFVEEPATRAFLDKKFILVVGLFLLLSLPFVDSLIKRLANSTLLAVLIKTVIFALAVYLVGKLI